MQCLSQNRVCRSYLFQPLKFNRNDNKAQNVKVDLKTFEAEPPLPVCGCGKSKIIEILIKCANSLRFTESPVRPNVLMFNDRDWNSDRSDEQRSRFSQFVKRLEYFICSENYQKITLNRIARKKNLQLQSLGLESLSLRLEERVSRIGYDIQGKMIFHQRKIEFRRSTLIRINLKDHELFYRPGDGEYLSIPMGCLDALTSIEEAMNKIAQPSS